MTDHSDPGGVGHPDEARLRELATEHALMLHFDGITCSPDGGGHRDGDRGPTAEPENWGFEACPHPDCVLVRQPVPPPGAVPAAQACEGGVTVRWCPRCGTCTCPPQHGNPDRWVEDPHCPIHGNRSTHDEPAAVPAAQDARHDDLRREGVQAAIDYIERNYPGEPMMREFTDVLATDHWGPVLTERTPVSHPSRQEP